MSRLRIQEAANGLSRDPVTHLINTHWHFDHTDGNQWLNAEGAAIIAHENTHKHLLVAQRVEDWDFNFPSSPLPAVPTETFSSEKTMKLNGSTLQLKYYGPAHTDSDISVAISEADIFHCADTYWNGIYPFIDYSTGGNIDGMIKAAEANVAAVTDKTIVIPGHGNPVSNKTELLAYRDMLVAIRDNVTKLKQQGHSLRPRPARQHRPARNDCRQTHCGVRCEMGSIRHNPSALHPLGLRRSLTSFRFITQPRAPLLKGALTCRFPKSRSASISR